MYKGRNELLPIRESKGTEQFELLVLDNEGLLLVFLSRALPWWPKLLML